MPALAQVNPATPFPSTARDMGQTFQEAGYAPLNDGRYPAGNPPRREIDWKNRNKPPVRTTAARNLDARDWWKVALPVVLFAGLILLAAAYVKKHGMLANRGLPREAFELLGKQYIDNRQSIQFVRCGSRVLIIGSTPNGLHPLAEITDPVEVDLLAGACRARRDDQSLAKSFRAMLSRERSEPPASHLNHDAGDVPRGRRESAAKLLRNSLQSAAAQGTGADD
jgi:flagellar biogenesis protein FliO